MEQPSIDGTRLAAQDYLARTDADLAALLDAADDLSRDVPGCPGWTVRDLLSHVLGVYRHKNAGFLIDGQPGEAPAGGWGALADDDDPRTLVRAEYDALRAHLDRDPATPSWTWWPPEQTVGFWQRRMAQETAVHRWDAESARYGVDGAAPVAPDLAADGIDELLGWLTWDWDEVQEGAAGQRVLVSTGEHSWTVALNPTSAEVTPGGADGEALVAGEPSALLLHLWGRPGEHEVARGGDLTALRLLAERLSEATT
ncbi:MAG TPA: maleylpyruvate isomerase family mycothiol-dependent enzyme [Candidatus Nanopelagicales bacterium]|nr:maleylpyruvate isomerase family mycothiol-dependent enzyme [Candidatus Nanopelagicales bacterium]